MDEDAQQQAAGPLPVLVLVSGMPATGKSTLAEELSTWLSWPLFTKDTFKEVLFDAAGYRESGFDEAASERLGAQSIALLLHIADRLIGAGVDLILEGNFRADLAADQFARFLAVANVRHVYCDLDTDLILERYQERNEDGERHPVHVDTGDPAELEAELAAKDYGPIPLPIPTLVVDTAEGFDPPIAEIVRFCRAATG
jgi:predicted kinase